MQTQEQSTTCLTISRTQGQSFNIGNDIVVQINKIQGKRVSVKIYAPKDVHVLRSELNKNFID